MDRTPTHALPLGAAPAPAPTPRPAAAARLRGLLGRLARDESGAEILEYVLIAGLIIAGTIVTVGAFGGKVMARWTSVNASL